MVLGLVAEIQPIADDILARLEPEQGAGFSQQLRQQTSIAQQGIADSMADIAAINTQVATAAEEQSQVSGTIQTNLDQVRELVSDNMVLIDQIAVASKALSEVAQEQEKQVTGFSL